MNRYYNDSLVGHFEVKKTYKLIGILYINVILLSKKVYMRLRNLFNMKDKNYKPYSNFQSLYIIIFQ